MKLRPSSLLLLALVAGYSAASFGASPQQPSNTIQRVAVDSDAHGLNLKISANAAVVPQTQLLNNPDRLVIDFPGSVMGQNLHNIAVNRDGVVRIRVGLFASNPPTTRVVIDLKSAASYQLSSQGENVLVRLDPRSVNVASQGRTAFACSNVADRSVARTERILDADPALRAGFESTGEFFERPFAYSFR